jgi:hypothetical protein
MDVTRGPIKDISDLPSYRVIFREPLIEFGVTNIEELRQVLDDVDRTAALIETVKGLGPVTVELWRSALSDQGEIVEEPESPQGLVEELVEDIEEDGESEESPLEIEQEAEPEVISEAEGPMEEEIGVPEPIEEVAPPIDLPRPNLFCTMDDVANIKRTAISLLKMNGAKRKGLQASVEYAVKKLRKAGLNPIVDEQSGAPVVVASHGEGGIILWGHLDNDSLGDIKGREQGVVSGDLIYGRGTVDGKGAVAALLCAAERLAVWPVPFSIVLTTDSLGQQKGAQALAQSPMVQNSIGILMLAPTCQRPVIGLSGYAALRVSIKEEGAIMEMVSFLSKLAECGMGQPGRFSVRTCMIRGGKRKQAFYPARSCEAMIELSTLDPLEDTMGTVDELLSMVDSNVEVLDRREIVRFDDSSSIVETILDLTNKVPAFDILRTEAGMVAPANPRIVMYGPGDPTQIRSEQEYVTVRDLEQTYEAILELVDRSAEFR